MRNDPSVYGNRPVWASNPAVPPVARVLAFTFGGLMLITIALALAGFRTVGGPTTPDKWFVFRSSKAYVTAYPEGWRVISSEEIAKHAQEDGDRKGTGVYPDIFTLKGGDGKTHIDVLVRDIPTRVNMAAIVDPASGLLGDMDDAIIERLRNPDTYGLTDVQTTSRAPKSGLETLCAYTANSEEEHETVPFRSRAMAIRGGWYYKVNGNRLMRIHGYAPAEDWPAMESILKEIGERVTWK